MDEGHDLSTWTDGRMGACLKPQAHLSNKVLHLPLVKRVARQQLRVWVWVGKGRKRTGCLSGRLVRGFWWQMMLNPANITPIPILDTTAPTNSSK